MSSKIKSYYNFAKLLSFNCTINGVNGGRGLGKTYGAKKKGTADALKSTRFKETTKVATKLGKQVNVTFIEGSTSNQFIYLRRYKEELSLARATFFADYEHEFPDWDFRLNGWKAEASPRKYAEMATGRPWSVIGYFVALSVAQNYKSVQFPNVKLIIFDEYILEKGGQYLPNEDSKFLNFINTVDRYKDKTRVLMLANSVSITNPYFIQWNIDPDKVDENGFIRFNSGYMLMHFPEAKEFQSEVKQTRYGAFISEIDPDYAEYAVGNQFSDNNKNLLEVKDYKAKYLFTLETKSGTFSIWYDLNRNMYFCQSGTVGNEDLRTLVIEKMSEGKTLVNFNDKSMQMLRTAYRNDRVRFTTAATRNAFTQIFKR